MDDAALKPLGRWEKIGVLGFFLFLLAFGGLVERRSAFLTRRMGDLDVFLRAAWAVRNDADLYAITSDNDWHYLYPPLYAILMTPLADPPRGGNPTGYVPYAVSVAICYSISLLSLFLGAHMLASALEERAPDPGFQAQPRFCRRWWMLRLWPIIICFLPIGHTLMRGQVNVIVLAALCAALAGWMRQQNFQAGLWLALAICIKIIPVFLLVYPLWKRDGRALLGCVTGCFLGLVLVPGLAFGPTRAVAHYENYAKAFLGPFFNVNEDDRTREELVSTDSIGVKNVLHNWMYPLGADRPDDMHIAAKAAYLLLGFVMTFLTLWPNKSSPHRTSGTDSASSDTSMRCAPLFACLILLMTFFSPVSHTHYLLFCLPIVMCLLARCWQHQATLRVPWLLTTCFLVFNVAMALAYLRGLEILRDRCVALFATLPLWLIPVLQMWRGAAVTPTAQELRKAA